MIREGRVTVNGEATSDPAVRVDAEHDEVCLDGEPVRPPPQKTYILLHKPAGLICTRRDPRDRATVYELLPAEAQHLVRSVGRLDRDSEGLLIFTDDGELLFRLTHPRYEVPKTYDVTVAGAVTSGQQNALRRGIELDDGMTAPAEVEVLERGERQTRLELTIHEGRKREIRRMMQALGHQVKRLVRVRMGPLKLGRLAGGQWRYLSRDEVAALRRCVGLSPSPSPL